MSQTSRSSPRHRSRRRTAIPARNSLHHILREHAGASLFVRPICWTDAHSRLLGAHFDELQSCDTPSPESMPGSPPSKGHMKPSRAIVTLSDALTEMLLPDTIHPVLVSNAVKTIMSTLWPTAFKKCQLLPELPIYFGDRIYRDAVRAQVMWNHPGDGPSSSQSSFKSISTRLADSYTLSSQSGPVTHNPACLPMMCYIGKNQLAAMRKNLFRVVPGPGRSWNGPVSRLQQLRSQALMPANSNHDAHFVALFLAMAQRHFYGPPVPSSSRDARWSPSGHKVHSPVFEDIKLRILTHDSDAADFIVYTGHVKATFLQRFLDPLKAPRCDDGDELPGIKIQYARIPIWPILGLRERLGKALGEEVVGPFDPLDMETWETDLEQSQPKDCKRKRQALCEVVNGSFEEEANCEDQRSLLIGKKRRLTDGSPVGVVR